MLSVDHSTSALGGHAHSENDTHHVANRESFGATDDGLQRYEVGPILGEQRRLERRCSDFRDDRDHSPPVTDDDRYGTQFVALLGGDRDEVPRRWTSPIENFTTEVESHEGTLAIYGVGRTRRTSKSRWTALRAPLATRFVEPVAFDMQHRDHRA